MTTERILVPANADGSAPLDVSVEALIVTGRPGGTLACGTVGDECGNYDSEAGAGTTYEQSSVFTGNVHETYVAIANSGDFRKDRLLKVYWAGTKPAPRKYGSDISLFNEGGNDDSKSVQDGVTYYKYTLILT